MSIGRGWREEEPEDSLQAFAVRELQTKLDYIWDKWKELSHEEQNKRSVKGKKV